MAIATVNHFQQHYYTYCIAKEEYRDKMAGMNTCSEYATIFPGRQCQCEPIQFSLAERYEVSLQIENNNPPSHNINRATFISTMAYRITTKTFDVISHRKTPVKWWAFSTFNTATMRDWKVNMCKIVIQPYKCLFLHN
jgi:hypothetical protein